MDIKYLKYICRQYMNDTAKCPMSMEHCSSCMLSAPPFLWEHELINSQALDWINRHTKGNIDIIDEAIKQVDK